MATCIIIAFTAFLGELLTGSSKQHLQCPAVSVKINFMMKRRKSCSGEGTSDPKITRGRQRAESPVPSCVSMKSDRSMSHPIAFSGDAAFTDSRLRDQDEPRCVVCEQLVTDTVSMNCEHSFCQQCITIYWDQFAPLGGFGCPQCKKRSLTDPVLHPYSAMEESLQQDSHTPVDVVLDKILQRHRTSMKNKFGRLFEGVQENQTLLNSIYTRLYIIEGEGAGVNEEHEVLKRTLRKQQSDVTPIDCVDIFKSASGGEGDTEDTNIKFVMAEGVTHTEPEEDKRPKVQKLRTVMTKGIAGIGKTVSVQKFILDWADEKSNQDADFLFVLPFRELNLIKDHFYSLHSLLCHFYADIKDLSLKMYDVLKVVFIFDGLDESRIPLNFSDCEKVSDISMISSVSVLMSNLIKGELLPSAFIWITSRPAAANQIPPQYINRVTEIQGFTDPQKEEYFRKRISDQDQAEKIISHIKTARSLHIMCYIPVFCWISATVFQQALKQTNQTEIPKTLTEMYIHFLCIQINMKNKKYENCDERDPKKLLEYSSVMILKLAELAFKQLIKGNIMFYEEDLRDCSIDVTQASVYSGICTEIFKEESVLCQKLYCFVHLSFHEFLAAFYVFYCYVNKDMEPLEEFKPQHWDRDWSESVLLHELLKGSVDKALKSENGHLDLFLRFLLGISLESNQRLLQGLLKHTESSSESISKTVKNIKDQIQTRHLPTERAINLFHCLTEMKDQSLSKGIQEYLQSEKHSGKKLSPGQCSALTYMLLTSEMLDELDLKKYNTSEEGYRRLIPAFSNCRRALLHVCNLSTDCVELICSTLTSHNTTVRELDLSNCPLENGVEMLCTALKSSRCKLKILRLMGCNVTKRSVKNLCSAFTIENSPLRELDLSNNELQDSGVESLSDGLISLHCKLEILRLVLCNLGEKSCKNLGSALQQAKSLKELDLSNNDIHDSGVKQLSAALKRSSCKLERLGLSGCLVTYEGCSALASALASDQSHLKKLDLTYNHLGDSGVKLLADPQCKLSTLRVEHAEKNRIKPGLRKYMYVPTLDPNTANTHLSLGEGNRQVMYVRKKHLYPDHPERFDYCEQVLCRECLPERCHWKAEWSGRVAIAVTYKGINRKERTGESGFGYNDKSWSLDCSSNRYSACHNKKDTVVVPQSRFRH